MIKKFICFILMAVGLLTLSLIAFGYYHVRHVLPIPKTVAKSTILELDFTKNFNEDSALQPFPKRNGSASFSLYEMVELIHQAAEDQRILGIVVHLGSPDLGIAQIQELRNAIKDFRNHGKYAYVHTEGFPPGSQGTKLYYLASAFDHISTQPMAEVSFIGLALESPFLRNFLNKHSIVPSFEKEGTYKSAPEMFLENDFSAANKEELLHVLDNIHHQISNAVSQERKLSLEQVQRLINKGPYGSFEAKTEGLIDAVGFYPDAKKQILEKAGKEASLLHQWEYAYDPLNMKKVALLRVLKKNPVKIALVYALGSIQESATGSLESKVITLRSLQKIFSHIAQDSTIRAVVLRIDSGGGEATISEAIAYEIELLQQKGIPVIVSMGDYAASGGYLMAAGAHRIFAQPGTITGSIGVYSGKFVTNAAWENYGVHWGLLKTAENADMWHTTSDFSTFTKERLKSLTQQVYKIFLEHVSKGRKLPLETLERIAQGRIWTGQQALEHHLVDSLGGLKEAIQYAKELIRDVPSYSIMVEIFPKPRSFIEHILQFLGIIEDDDDINFGFNMRTEIKHSLKELYKELMAQTTSLKMTLRLS